MCEKLTCGEGFGERITCLREKTSVSNNAGQRGATKVQMRANRFRSLLCGKGSASADRELLQLKR